MSEQSQLGPSQGASVVLDIGGDVGALILHTGAELAGVEIEISPADGTAQDVFQAEYGPKGDEHTHEHEHEHDHEHEHEHQHEHDHEHSHADPSRTHVAVRERIGPDGHRFAAIYPGLTQGEYTIWNQDGTPAQNVVITGGQVTEVDWR